MGKRRLPRLLAVALAAISIAGCDDDEEAKPPEGGEDYALEVESITVTDLARALDSGAIDARATERGVSTPRDVGRSHAQVVLAYGSAVGALSRAVRGLAVAPAPAS